MGHRWTRIFQIYNSIILPRSHLLPSSLRCHEANFILKHNKVARRSLAVWIRKDYDSAYWQQKRSHRLKTSYDWRGWQICETKRINILWDFCKDSLGSWEHFHYGSKVDLLGYNNSAVRGPGWFQRYKTRQYRSPFKCKNIQFNAVKNAALAVVATAEISPCVVKRRRLLLNHITSIIIIFTNII